MGIVDYTAHAHQHRRVRKGKRNDSDAREEQSAQGTREHFFLRGYTRETLRSQLTAVRI
jgi:hypothetical protein